MSKENAQITRAELVRRRREQARKNRARPASRRRKRSRTRYEQTSPPVFMRTGSARMPVRQRGRASTRRRFDLALGASGAELRFPALPVMGLSWRFFSGCLVAVLLAVLINFWQTPAYRVSSAKVKGVQRVTDREINLVLGLSGDPVFSLDPQQLERELSAAFPEFKSVSVRVDLPNRVVVLVEERQPALVWQRENGVVWIDAEGVVFPPRGEVGPLPLVNGIDFPLAPSAAGGDANPLTAVYGPQRSLLPETVTAILEVADFAPEGAVLLYDATRGIGWEDPLGWQVYFGTNGDQMETRLQVYLALVEKLKAEGIQPALISLEHLHAPYYRIDR